MMINYHPIGIAHSPFHDIANMPIQPAAAEGVTGTLEIYPEFVDGLQDLEGFSHIIVLYYFHRVTRQRLSVTPFLDDVPRGVFATRAPCRPNPIGLSVVCLQRREGGVLYVENLDMLDETPILDLKPYIPDFDAAATTRLGWLEAARERVKHARSDARFR